MRSRELRESQSESESENERNIKYGGDIRPIEWRQICASPYQERSGTCFHDLLLIFNSFITPFLSFPFVLFPIIHAYLLCLQFSSDKPWLCFTPHSQSFLFLSLPISFYSFSSHSRLFHFDIHDRNLFLLVFFHVICVKLDASINHASSLFLFGVFLYPSIYSQSSLHMPFL